MTSRETLTVRNRIEVDGVLYESVDMTVKGWDVTVGENSATAVAAIAPSVQAVGDALCEVRVESFGGEASVTFVVEDEAVAEDLTADLDVGETLEGFVTSHLDKFRKAFVKVLDHCATHYLAAAVLVSSPDYAKELSRDYARYFRRYLSQSLH